MPKMKTNRAARKRFRLTATGKVRRNRANKSHILTKKARKRKRHLRQSTTANAASRKNLTRLLPYGAD